jgi:MFS family permease
VSAATAEASATGSYRSALAHRDYRWLLTGLIVSTVGSWAYNVALIVFVFDRTGSANWLAATSLARFIPALLFSPYGGVIAEKVERRGLMIRLDVISTLVMVGLALVSGLDGPVVIALALAGCSSVIGSVYFPATAAMTPQVVGESDLAAANALNGVVENTAVIAGPAIGALIMIGAPPEIAFLVNAATFLFSAFASSRVRTRSEPADVTEGGSAGVLEQVSVGFRAITSSSTAAMLVAFSVIASFFYGTDTVLFAVLSEGPLDLGAKGFGYLLAGLGVGGILASLFVNKLAGSTRLALIISAGLIVYVLPTALYVVVDDPSLGIGIQVVRGAGTLIVDVLAVTALQRALAPDLIARVFGVFGALVLGAISIGALLTPILLNTTSLDTTLLIYSLGTTGLIVLFYPKTRSIDRESAARLAEISERIEAIEDLGIFASASRPVLERLAGAAGLYEVSAGDRIITEGEESDAFYVILDGTVDVSAVGEGGVSTFIRTMEPGQGFGEIGLLRRGPRTATVDAVSDVSMYRIAGDDFVAALTEVPPSSSFLDGARSKLALTHPSHQWDDTLEHG